jgi:acetyl-CoA synthetase
MVHTTAGYMVYTAYTFKNVFNYEENDIFGVPLTLDNRTLLYLYGPLLNGATTVILKEFLLIQISVVFWEIIEKHKVSQFYTAPTIRAFEEENLEYVQTPFEDLKSYRFSG